jgi:two-component system, NtrC family, nitrogen regulation response regulator NtrX
MAARVLLLEDDPALRELLGDVLAEDGHQVRACASRGELRALAEGGSGDLALVDAWGASHQALSDEERLEISELAEAVPTIMVTGRSWAEMTGAEELGLVAIVRKPLDVFALGELVTRSHRVRGE